MHESSHVTAVWLQCKEPKMLKFSFRVQRAGYVTCIPWILVDFSSLVLVFVIKSTSLLVCSVCCSHSCSLGYMLNEAFHSLYKQTYSTVVCFIFQQQAGHTTAIRHLKDFIRMPMSLSHPGGSPLTLSSLENVDAD